MGAIYKSEKHPLLDMFSSLVIIEMENKVISGQNQKSAIDAAETVLKMLN